MNFVRFAGCNRWSGLERDRPKSFCAFCDTDFRGGDKLSSHDILSKLKNLGGPKRVVLSGGEPTLQIDMDLLTCLKNNGYEIHLETNGSRALGRLLGLFDHITVSPKQSRAETKLERCDDLKLLYPLSNKPVTIEAFEDFPARQRFLQPVMDAHYDSNLRGTILRIYDNPNWRLSLQTHKIAEVE